MPRDTPTKSPIKSLAKKSTPLKSPLKRLAKVSTPTKSSPRKCLARKFTPGKSLRTETDIISSQAEASSSCAEAFEHYQPSVGLSKDEDVEREGVFKATPLKTLKSIKADPPSTGKITQRLSGISVSSPTVETPHEVRRSLRRKMKIELASLNASTVESDPEDSDDGADDKDSESEDDVPKSASQTPSKKKQKSYKSFAETYFFAQKQKKNVTSNRTLSNLKLGKTDIEQLQQILNNAPEYHKKEKEVLYKQYSSKFKKWKLLMHEGFNILLYGVGSKQKVLTAFCSACLADSLYVVIHGFFPSLNLKQILSSITEDALDDDRKFPSLYEHTEYVKRYFTEGDEDLYLVFHNIDGMALRSVKVQTMLSSLADIPRIHFIASIDHINAPLMWNQIMLSHFKWIWFDVTTFEPYIMETSYENSIFKDQSSHLLLSSLLHVYRSLTPNGQGVFMILAKRQFDEKERSFSGMAFPEWYQECRESFLVNSEITMQAQLSEFKNHKLLTSKKSVEGSELWYIPVDAVTLEQFLEKCK